MKKGSKKRHQAIKILKSLYHGFTRRKIEDLARYAKEIAKLPNGDFVVDETLNIEPETGDADKKFILQFDYFDQSECVFESFNPTRAEALFRIFKRITSLRQSELNNSGLIRGNVANEGSYESLYKKLPSPDIDLKEITFVGSGRIFFFTFKEKFYIVSVETTHRNID